MADNVKVEIKKLTDFVPDPENANRGTQRGLSMLETSVQEDGAGRSLLATADGTLIAGNKTQQALVDAGLEEVVVVHTDGRQVVVVQRDDVQSGTTEARRMALRDNRIGEVGLDWDPEVLASLVAEDDTALEGLWYDWEIANILGDGGTGPNWEEEWRNMPEFEQGDILGACQSIKVHFASREAVQGFSSLIGQSITDKTRYIWFPQQEKMDLKKYRCEDES